jgi:small neutral amino acid transporter SnatA (MarC family)
MVEPPSLVGAVYVTVAAVAVVPVAVPIVGAPGTFAVVILFDAALFVPVPAPFVAVTENV